MRRTLLFVIAGIALLGLGVGAGILLQRQYEVMAARAAEDIARDLTGLDGPRPPAPAWDTWTYPGADLKRGGRVGGIQMNEEVVVPSDHHVVWTTPDPFEDVVVHYARLLNFDDPESFSERKPTFGGASHLSIDSESGPAANVQVIDNRGERGLELRPVRVESLTRRCRSYTVTVFISRADDEELTHVIVLYDPLVATAAVVDADAASPDGR